MLTAWCCNWMLVVTRFSVSYFRIFASARLSLKKLGTRQIHLIGLSTIYQYVKYYHNISNALSIMMAIIMFSQFFFASTRLFITIYNEIWHLTISLVRSCQYVSAWQKISKYSKRFKIIITVTYLYNYDPLKPHFYTVKLGFTGVYILFLISAQKHRLWVLVRTTLLRRF